MTESQQQHLQKAEIIISEDSQTQGSNQESNNPENTNTTLNLIQTNTVDNNLNIVENININQDMTASIEPDTQQLTNGVEHNNPTENNNTTPVDTETSSTGNPLLINNTVPITPTTPTTYTPDTTNVIDTADETAVANNTLTTFPSLDNLTIQNDVTSKNPNSKIVAIVHPKLLPKRPTKPFLIFTREKREFYRAKLESEENYSTGINTLLGDIWQEMDPKEKAIYQQEYIRESEAYQARVLRLGIPANAKIILEHPPNDVDILITTEEVGKKYAKTKVSASNKDKTSLSPDDATPTDDLNNQPSQLNSQVQLNSSNVTKSSSHNDVIHNDNPTATSVSSSFAVTINRQFNPNLPARPIKKTGVCGSGAGALERAKRVREEVEELSCLGGLTHEIPVQRTRTLATTIAGLSSLSTESASLISLAGEEFVLYLTECMLASTTERRKRTITIDELQRCVKSDPCLQFLRVPLFAEVGEDIVPDFDLTPMEITTADNNEHYIPPPPGTIIKKHKKDHNSGKDGVDNDRNELNADGTPNTAVQKPKRTRITKAEKEAAIAAGTDKEKPKSKRKTTKQTTQAGEADADSVVGEDGNVTIQGGDGASIGGVDGGANTQKRKNNAGKQSGAKATNIASGMVAGQIDMTNMTNMANTLGIDLASISGVDGSMLANQNILNAITAMGGNLNNIANLNGMINFNNLNPLGALNNTMNGLSAVGTSTSGDINASMNNMGTMGAMNHAGGTQGTDMDQNALTHAYFAQLQAQAQAQFLNLNGINPALLLANLQLQNQNGPNATHINADGLAQPTSNSINVNNTPSDGSNMSINDLSNLTESQKKERKARKPLSDEKREAATKKRRETIAAKKLLQETKDGESQTSVQQLDNAGIIDHNTIQTNTANDTQSDMNEQMEQSAPIVPSTTTSTISSDNTSVLNPLSNIIPNPSDITNTHLTSTNPVYLAAAQPVSLHENMNLSSNPTLVINTHQEGGATVPMDYNMFNSQMQQNPPQSQQPNINSTNPYIKDHTYGMFDNTINTQNTFQPQGNMNSNVNTNIVNDTNSMNALNNAVYLQQQQLQQQQLQQQQIQQQLQHQQQQQQFFYQNQFQQ